MLEAETNLCRTFPIWDHSLCWCAQFHKTLQKTRPQCALQKTTQFPGKALNVSPTGMAPTIPCFASIFSSFAHWPEAIILDGQRNPKRGPQKLAKPKKHILSSARILWPTFWVLNWVMPFPFPTIRKEGPKMPSLCPMPSPPNDGISAVNLPIGRVEGCQWFLFKL